MKTRVPEKVEYTLSDEATTENVDLVFDYLFEKVFARLKKENSQELSLSNVDK